MNVITGDTMITIQTRTEPALSIDSSLSFKSVTERLKKEQARAKNDAGRCALGPYDARIRLSDVCQPIPIDDRDESPYEVDRAVDHRGRRNGDGQREHHNERGPTVFDQRSDGVSHC